MPGLNFFGARFLTTILMVVVVLTFVFFINSCRKKMPPCTKNCVDISISGKVTLKPSSTSLPNLPVELTWYQKQYCIICSSLKVARTHTSASGSFTFTATIDSSLFNTYYLAVRVIYDTAKYIADPNDGGFYTNYIQKRFYNFISLSNTVAQFDLYPKTSLTINFHRVLNDNFDYFIAGHKFIDALQYGDYTIHGQQFAKDTTVHTVTSAGLYTKFSWSKRIGTAPFIENSDSILCTLNGPNVFNINY